MVEGQWSRADSQQMRWARPNLVEPVRAPAGCWCLEGKHRFFCKRVTWSALLPGATEFCMWKAIPTGDTTNATSSPSSFSWLSNNFKQKFKTSKFFYLVRSSNFTPNIVMTLFDFFIKNAFWNIYFYSARHVNYICYCLYSKETFCLLVEMLCQSLPTFFED